MTKSTPNSSNSPINPTDPLNPITPISPEEENEENIEEILKTRTEELQALEERKKEEEKKSRQAEIEKRKEEGATHAAKEKKVQIRKKFHHGKKYRQVSELVEKGKFYTLDEAVELIKKLSTSKFDASVDIHVRVADKNTRGLVKLPAGSGKPVKVAIASDQLIEEIEKGQLDFDVLVTNPSMMPKLAKVARILGPKGLMPTPKSGTISETPEDIKADIESGKVEFRVDSARVVHQSIGRVSWENEKLMENIKAFIQALTAHKIQSIALAPTMGPSVRLKVES